MSARVLQFVVPGRLTEATGGYGYDRRLIEGLGSLGWEITVHSLDCSFPLPTQQALAEAAAVLASLPDGALVLIDGLALGGMPEVVGTHSARLRLIGLIHHPLALENGLAPAVADQLRRSEEAALRCMRRVIVTSAHTRDGLASYGVASARISVVEPGTDAAPLARGSQDDSYEMLCVANVIPRKGHDLLIEALADLQHLDWHLTCVGSLQRSQETAAALRRRIAMAGLEARIRMTGELDGSDLEQCFQAADLFVLPTRYEGFGMVVAEALARGLPVVATRTGAIPDLVLPDAGIVLPPEDVGALRNALSFLLTDPNELVRFAQGARAARARLPGWSHACANAARILTEAARR